MSPAEAAIREALAAALPDEHEALDAACNPVAIRTLLSDLAALRARCEAADALLREVRVDGRLIISGSDIDQRIDAHLKGANHG